MKETITKKELSGYYFLTKDIEKLKERLEQKRIAIYGAKSPKLTGMPRGGDTARSKVEADVSELIDLEQEIAEKEQKAADIRNRLEIFISRVGSEKVRRIMTARCVKGMSWYGVADFVGEGMTEENARQIYCRYVNAHFEEKNAKKNEAEA